MDYADRYPEAFVDLSKWLSEGRITRKFHVVEGLEKAPESLPLLFSGGNTGKLFVLVFLYPISRFSDSMSFLGLFTSRALKRNCREKYLDDIYHEILHGVCSDTSDVPSLRSVYR